MGSETTGKRGLGLDGLSNYEAENPGDLGQFVTLCGRIRRLSPWDQAYLGAVDESLEIEWLLNTSPHHSSP